MGDIAYVVTSGSYSDYHIIAVFTDKEKAERCEQLYSDAVIEEYTLNELPFKGVPNGLVVYTVKMFITGGVYHLYRTNPKDASGSFTYHSPSPYRKFPTDNRWVLDATVYARDRTHAVKIVNEKRAALIAANRWPENIDPSNFYERREIEDW